MKFIIEDCESCGNKHIFESHGDLDLKDYANDVKGTFVYARFTRSSDNCNFFTFDYSCGVQDVSVLVHYD